MRLSTKNLSVISFMEKGAKILRLCSALIRHGLAIKLLAELKAEWGVKHKLYLLLNHIIKNHDGQGNLRDAHWSLEDWAKAYGNLSKTLWELKNVIDAFLLKQGRSSEYQLYRKTELFYHYRDLGLLKENVENLREIETLAQQTKDKRLQLLFAEFRQEIALFNNEKEIYSVELSHAFYLYWVSEALFDACIKSFSSYPHNKLMLPPTPIQVIRNLVLESPLLLADEEIHLYLNIYDFIHLQTPSLDLIQTFEKETLSSLDVLPPNRKRDVITLIGNKYINLFSTYKTLLYGKLAWKYCEASLQLPFVYVGNKISFKTYRNLILLCIVAHEYTDSSEMLSNRLLKLQEHYEKRVAFPPKEDKQKLLFDLQLDWKLRRNLSKIDNTNSATFTADDQKAELLLYQLKAGYTLVQSQHKSYQAFWEWAAEKYKKKNFSEASPFHTEFMIWKALVKIHLSAKKRPDCLATLDKLHNQLNETTFFYHDRNWYISLIEKALS